MHDDQQSINPQTLNAQALAKLGTGVVAYMRSITANEIKSSFPETPELQQENTYWALFAADGTPLALADNRDELASSAFYNDLNTILPN